jgi:glutathione S-transferase
MQLYFAPLACSLATRIALYEAGGKAEFVPVDLKRKRLADGGDFHAVNPLGQVPALLTDGGVLLTENSAVLQYVADRFPAARLAPPPGEARAQLQVWLGFIGTELHKGVFTPLLDAKAPEGAKQYAREKVPSRFGHLDRHLAGREFLLDGFSVADAYLVTLLNWTFVTGISLADYPALAAFYHRMLARPSVREANQEERALYAAEQAKVAEAP